MSPASRGVTYGQNHEPASSCFRCRTPGQPTTDQTNTDGDHLADSRTAFICPKCLHCWTTDTSEARAHGWFLQRAGLA